MATVNMNSDVLELINNIYDNKEQACEISGLLENLKVSCGWNIDYERKLATIEYDTHGNRKFINESKVPEELRKRLIQCVDDYYDEMLKTFESMTVTSEILSPEPREAEV